MQDETGIGLKVPQTFFFHLIIPITVDISISFADVGAEV